MRLVMRSPCTSTGVSSKSDEPMNAADLNGLDDAEKTHFYKCQQCGEMVDKRQLDEVLFHETNHKPRPDTQYGGSVRIEE
jgi:hypothetical protein